VRAKDKFDGEWEFMMTAKYFVAALMSFLVCACALAPTRKASSSDFAEFLDRVDNAQLEFQNGRPEAYKTLWSHQSDVTLGGGFGGSFERGWDKVAKRLDWASSQFKNGSNEIRRLASSESADLGYLIQTEHLHFTSPSSNAPVERFYRVTMLFRREDGQWRIIHRHADTQTLKEAPR
jgi:hypothetical protein